MFEVDFQGSRTNSPGDVNVMLRSAGTCRFQGTLALVARYIIALVGRGLALSSIGYLNKEGSGEIQVSAVGESRIDSEEQFPRAEGSIVQEERPLCFFGMCGGNNFGKDQKTSIFKGRR